MFRGMRRFKQQAEDEVCKEILREQVRGVLAVHGEEGYPYALPINFWYDEEKNLICIHGAPVGHKIDAMKKHEKVSFTAMNEGHIEEGGWKRHITSVIIFGRAHAVEDAERSLEIGRKIAEKVYPTQEIVDETVAKYTFIPCWEIEIDHMTGKNVTEA